MSGRFVLWASLAALVTVYSGHGLLGQVPAYQGQNAPSARSTLVGMAMVADTPAGCSSQVCGSTCETSCCPRPAAGCGGGLLETLFGPASCTSRKRCGMDCGMTPLDPLFGVSRCRPDGFFVDTWLAQGFTGNPDSPTSRFNGPLTFNDRSNEYQMNQFYVSFGRAVDTRCRGWDLGGRADFLYGTDYYFTTAIGLETHQDGTPHWNSADGPRGAGAALYGAAMPQLYAEVLAPVGNGLSLKLGHFYTTLGYESVMAPNNFFYSHAYTKQYGEPFTHTGLLASYDWTPCLTVHAGLTRGWDNWEDPNDTLGFLGGLRWTSRNKATSFGFALHTGNEDAAGDDNRTVYSAVLTRQINPRLRYVFQHDFGIEERAAVNSRWMWDEARWYGINQYFFYKLSRATELGLRVEWFRDEDNARVLAVPFDPVVDGGNYVGLTFGVNWKPSECVVLRPEIRWDWSDVEAPTLNNFGMFDDFQKNDQFTLGLDLITKF